MAAAGQKMKAAAANNTPFSEEELSRVVASLQLAAAAEADERSPPPYPVDWDALRSLVADHAHLSHKDWPRTEKAADRLARVLSGPANPGFRHTFHRVLADGRWDDAVAAAAGRLQGKEHSRPWVVLVTGLNGIRKTTAVHQPWFKMALASALQHNGQWDTLPDGSNSFFRQLDYMITTVASEEFRQLYALDGEDVDAYSAMKAGIFSRYRTLAEMLGVLLLKEARQMRANVLVETSGRDVASFHYIDHLFPAESRYRKLVLHFEINDLRFAAQSVDARMAAEMRRGRAALQGGKVREIVSANAGGPYGSQVLAGVKADSDRVWSEVTSGTAGIDSSAWLKASFRVTARDDGPWTLQPINPATHQACGQEYPFVDAAVP